jgi:acetylornithine deacetylase/succinyl-diaminopimelate desuccinylase-like protein
MNSLLNALQSVYALPKHDFLGQATVTVLDICASPGALTPIVPDRCEAIIDRRFLPEETETELIKGFEEIFRRLKVEDPEFEADVEPLKWFPAMFTDPNAPIVQAMVKARKEVLGDTGAIGAWYFGVDGTFINQAGIPCVGFGPGNEYLAHTPRDVVPVRHLVNAAKVYAKLIKNVCCQS